jgi:hypothetical protein
MADRPGLGDVLRDALKANARYYESIGQLTSSWLRELADVSSGLRLPRVSVDTAPVSPRLSVVRPSASPPESSSQPSPVSQLSQPSAVEKPAPAATLVLEAAAGETAMGAFLVENTLGSAVSQAVEVGAFTDEEGVETVLQLTFEPSVIKLAAGEQVVVRTSVVIPEAVGTESRATVRVAGVPGAEIPVVVRRTGP